MTTLTVSARAVAAALKDAGMTLSQNRAPYRSEGFYAENGMYRGQPGTVFLRFEAPANLTMRETERYQSEQCQIAATALLAAGYTIQRGHGNTLTVSA